MYDLIVIGGGSGGVRAARMWGALGKKVLLVEANRMGGTCVLHGCIPKKLMIYSSSYNKSIQYAENFGWTIPSRSYDIQKFMQNKNNELERLSNIYSQLMNQANVDVKYGTASFIDNNTIQVGDEKFSSKRILIATGSRSVVPAGLEGAEHVVHSNDFLNLQTLEKKITIVGGGYIAVEFASILANLGVEVDLIIRSTTVLTAFDLDIRKAVSHNLMLQGVNIISGTEIIKITKEGDKSYQLVSNKSKVFTTNMVVYATGRAPNVEPLKLENTDIKLKSGSIIVDDNYETNVKGIFAVGDIINHMSLTPVAIAQSMYLIKYWQNLPVESINYSLIATAVFTYPEVAICGPSEHELRSNPEFVDDLDIYISNTKSLAQSISKEEKQGILKIIVQKSTQKVLAMHICCDYASEIMQGFAVAIKKGITKADLDSTVGIHPSMAEELVTMRTKQ